MLSTEAMKAGCNRFGQSRLFFRVFVLAAAMLLVISACAVSGNGHALLVKGATVIDPSAGTVVNNHCIRISNHRIDSVEPCKPNETAGRVIDATGSWVVPGLWDMHVHALWDESVYCPFFSDFVSYGVVGVRDMGGDAGVLTEARAFLEQAGNIGPTLVAAGKVLDGPTPVHPEISMAVRSAEDGRQAVAAVDAMGADFVKVYTTLPKAAVAAVFDEAHERGLKVVGHLPLEITLSDAVDAGMAGIEHMAVEIGGLCDVGNELACKQTMDQLRRAGIYLTPTLLVRQRPATVRDPAIAEMSRLASMPDIVAKEWSAGLERSLRNKPDRYFAEKAQQYLREQRLTEIAIASDSLLLVGTDSGDFLVPPGSSMHEELELLVNAGMDEMAALYAATGRATDYLNLTDRGYIQPGAAADLVLLNSNPLADIRNTRDIGMVILNGAVLDSEKLASLRLRQECH
ncbi:MAG: amidohydrolase family protein [Woeseia sp.]